MAGYTWSLKTTIQILPNFLHILPVAVAQSSDGNAMNYVLPVLWMTSCFPHKGANGPESKMTRMFRPVRQVAAPGRSLPSLNVSCSCCAPAQLICRVGHQSVLVQWQLALIACALFTPFVLASHASLVITLWYVGNHARYAQLSRVAVRKWYVTYQITTLCDLQVVLP